MREEEEEEEEELVVVLVLVVVVVEPVVGLRKSNCEAATFGEVMLAFARESGCGGGGGYCVQGYLMLLLLPSRCTEYLSKVERDRGR